MVPSLASRGVSALRLPPPPTQHLPKIQATRPRETAPGTTSKVCRRGEVMETVPGDGTRAGVRQSQDLFGCDGRRLGTGVRHTEDSTEHVGGLPAPSGDAWLSRSTPLPRTLLGATAQEQHPSPARRSIPPSGQQCTHPIKDRTSSGSWDNTEVAWAYSELLLGRLGLRTDEWAPLGCWLPEHGSGG